MNPQPKSGSLYCPAWLDFVRALNCHFCGRAPRSSAHHWPPKGRGVTRDDNTIAVCEPCHKLCHGEVIPGLRPIAKERQTYAVLSTRSQFLEDATDKQVGAYLDSRREWNLERGLPF